MTIHTNRCKHCGKTKPEHSRIEMNGYPDTWACVLVREVFEDSGLAALDAHKEELYEAARDLVEEARKMAGVSEVFPRLENILNQIEKEK